MATSGASLLRLNNDVWTSIAYFFEGSEAVTLLRTGNRLLIDRLRQATRCLSLTWTVARYTQISDVLATVNRFTTLWNLKFTSDTFCLEAINWTSLPSSLRRLKMTFPGVVHHLMSNKGLGSILPHLEVLELRDVDHVNFTKRRYRADFRDLPSGLLKLRLARSTRIWYTVST